MAVSISEQITYKRAVAAGNDEIWYEDIDMATGTMIELAAANSDIDTSDNLNIFSGFQKTFIINGSNLKIADFINIKLTHTALSTAHAKGDILTQATSDATMIVDFTNTAKTATYGYVTSGTFDCTNAITGSGSGTGFTPTGINGMLTHTALGTVHAAGDTLTQATTSATMVVEYTDTTKTHTWGRITSGTFNTTNQVTGDGSGTAFTPTATDTSPPLWYNWTVYPGGTSGTMPDEAYLGCLYRGRATLSGNSDYPYQWYMARQNNPWDFAYTANDAQSPVFGSNADAGEMGDIIRALIPYEDDYLIFGCANSIWYLAGDPAVGGEINQLDSTTGIFGANSWCFGNEKNLYFWGDNGIYMTTIPGKPKCISQIQLPNLVNDEAADPSTHRIIMEFDRKNVGILITITKLMDGSNSNWWFDLRSGGLFPESYPNECGAYAMCYYGANDTDYRDLLVGCRDGYIRKFDHTAKNDDIGASNQAINSYLSFGPISLMKNPDISGKTTKLDLVSAGGGSGGSQSDSDDIDWKLFGSNSAEKVIEQLSANSNPKLSGVFKAPGRWLGSGRKQKIKSKYIGIRLGNSTSGETWGLEKVILTAKKSGRIK